MTATIMAEHNWGEQRLASRTAARLPIAWERRCGRDYTRARISVLAVLCIMLAAAPSRVPLSSQVTIDWPVTSVVAAAVHIPHLAVRIAIEVTP